MFQNESLDLALSYIQYTNKNVFLTGKAGTGKTTFLQKIKKDVFKRSVIIAPTGVAAINAGGVTIHSFFQLPFGPQIPESLCIEKGIRYEKQFKLSKNKILLIKGIDLLIIDEISMVRADMLDAIDEILRRYKDKNKPFGGVQLLMIGDLFQLPPIVKNDEWNLLKDYYDTAYFFSSKALKLSEIIHIELKHIYRQSDAEFINILGDIRENNISLQTLEVLNKRFIPNFKYNDNDGYIELTTHNAFANKVNSTKLQELKTETHTFKAQITGEFPEYIYPTEKELDLKIGAQVMFVKNDSSAEKLYYNGKIGRIVNIEEDIVFVSCTEDNSTIEVKSDTWNNVKYLLDENSKEIKEDIKGSFTQHPLKLAWAITIHKSQGLTFEKAIVDAEEAFAFGQVYVALSRCRTLEGLVLRSPIHNSSIKSDAIVSDYTLEMGKNPPNKNKLEADVKSFQEFLLLEIFDFSLLKYRFIAIEKFLKNTTASFDETLKIQFNDVFSYFFEKILSVAEKFKRQLHSLFVNEYTHEKNPILQERFMKACAYFEEATKEIDSEKINLLPFETDNKEAKKEITELLIRLNKEIFIKKHIFTEGAKGFSILSYLRTKIDAEIDFEKNNRKPTLTHVYSSKSIPHPDLYHALNKWREILAFENKVSPAKILPRKSLARILSVLPSTIDELLSIKGIGKNTVQKFGEEILGIINDYCHLKNISRSSLSFDKDDHFKKPSTKGDSHRQTLSHFKEGKTVKQIALERNLATSTIESHLIHFIAKGELNIYELLPKNKIVEIQEYLLNNQVSSISQAKNNLSDEISYSDIRAVINHLKINSDG